MHEKIWTPGQTVLRLLLAQRVIVDPLRFNEVDLLVGRDRDHLGLPRQLDQRLPRDGRLADRQRPPRRSSPAPALASRSASSGRRLSDSSQLTTMAGEPAHEDCIPLRATAICYAFNAFCAPELSGHRPCKGNRRHMHYSSSGFSRVLKRPCDTEVGEGGFVAFRDRFPKT
jgi:hypothetical protein